jgi:outer membrane protein OmpA-like peptidoglycan-associated protein
MTASRIFLSAACVLVFATPAGAQMYPGQGVSVNPAATQGGRTVVYPGGTYVRLPPLLEPGQPYPGTQGQPIQLHMPTQHRERRRAVVRKETPPPQEDVATAPPPPAPVSHHVVRQEAPAPQSTADTNTNDSTGNDPASTIPFSFGGTAPVPQHAAPGKHALPPGNTHAEARPKARLASVSNAPETTTITRAPATSMTPGEEGPDLSKRSEILFPHNGSEPTEQSASQLRELASDLNSALDAGARRVQLDAFGGAPGDKSSDARRVSLRRALVIRQLLINDGVPASRIDVRAMGGIDDSGNADRVDVYVRAG